MSNVKIIKKDITMPNLGQNIFRNGLKEPKIHKLGKKWLISGAFSSPVKLI